MTCWVIHRTGPIGDHRFVAQLFEDRSNAEQRANELFALNTGDLLIEETAGKVLSYLIR